MGSLTYAPTHRHATPAILVSSCRTTKESIPGYLNLCTWCGLQRPRTSLSHDICVALSCGVHCRHGSLASQDRWTCVTRYRTVLYASNDYIY